MNFAAPKSARQARPLAIVNARLLDPATRLDQRGGILVQEGLIADLGPRVGMDGLPDGVERVDAGGRCLAPGLIDMRVQLREPGEEHKETIASGGAAAAAGGVTTMICLPNTDPVIDDVASVEFIARRARETRRSKVYCYGAVTKGLAGKDLAEFGLLTESGALGFTDGLAAVRDARVMLRALSYARCFDALIIQHPEHPSLAEGGAMNAGELSTRLGLSGIPRQAEVMMIERDLHLVEMTGGRYHVAHVSTGPAIAAIRRAKQMGLRITCDTAPPYFALNELEVGDYRTFAKLSPPLRGEDDRRAVAAAIADGTIDCIASDHAPHDQESKRVPFAQAAAGVIGLETLLPVSLGLHHRGEIDLLDLLARMTVAPADLFGLPQGRLAKGAPADLVLFDREFPRKLDAATFRSKSKNSPFDGRPVQGRVLRTVVDGRTVFSAED
ncbi:MAG: dihydroorotase [Dongiaceae bacterium]